ncbi:AbrB/MazE/SpoVT family DNA-binding domain-containing protein [Sphingomonas sp.]|uniref:AbrB/MazE/SpoVT family DNA-binding domain-containing protein n=1 Tax=Sphingomonas sp. TaxID=28214 RepID=UPI00334219B1
MTYQAKVIAGGKLVIPADLRRELGIKTGDSLIVDRDDEGRIVLKTRAQVVQEVRDTFRALRGPSDGNSVVDELIAERREEGRREDLDLEAWLAARR